MFALLAIVSACAAHSCFERGYTLYDGDSEAHLNIARRILDSRTPGLEQIGTVWLPLPHVLMIWPSMTGSWWRSGAAGAIVSPACSVLAGTFLFAAARRAYSSAAAGLAVALMFALNPNLLYLESTAMTEALFAASVGALLWATLWFRDSQSIFAIVAAGVASNAASLTRYEGWFFIPFVSLYLLFVAKRKWHAVLFGALAALAPLAWLTHNRFYYGNALRVLQRSLVRYGHLSARAGGRDEPLSWRSRLASGAEILFDGGTEGGRLACDRSGSYRRIHCPVATSLVAPRAAGARAGVLCVEHALIGHADLRSGFVAK